MARSLSTSEYIFFDEESSRNVPENQDSGSNRYILWTPSSWCAIKAADFFILLARQAGVSKNEEKKTIRHVCFLLIVPVGHVVKSK